MWRFWQLHTSTIFYTFLFFFLILLCLVKALKSHGKCIHSVGTCQFSPCLAGTSAGQCHKQRLQKRPWWRWDNYGTLTKLSASAKRTHKMETNASGSALVRTKCSRHCSQSCWRSSCQGSFSTSTDLPSNKKWSDKIPSTSGKPATASAAWGAAAMAAWLQGKLRPTIGSNSSHQLDLAPEFERNH